MCYNTSLLINNCFGISIMLKICLGYFINMIPMVHRNGINNYLCVSSIALTPWYNNVNIAKTPIIGYTIAFTFFL